MRILLILAGLTLSLAAQSQEIWRWVDKSGVVHYADQPGSPDAVLVSVVDPNSYQDSAPPADYSSGGNPGDSDGAPPPYESLAIVQPAVDQVFFGADATVQVVAELDGGLRPGHRLIFYVNGIRREATSGLTLELRNLARGTYTLQASVQDEANVALVTSEQVAFHVRQPSINSPQSPQKPRTRIPAPKPAT